MWKYILLSTCSIAFCNSTIINCVSTESVGFVKTKNDSLKSTIFKNGAIYTLKPLSKNEEEYLKEYQLDNKGYVFRLYSQANHYEKPYCTESEGFIRCEGDLRFKLTKKIMQFTVSQITGFVKAEHAPFLETGYCYEI